MGYNRLIERVKEMHTPEDMKEIVKHGCVAGTSLIYYRETCAFYDEFKTEIWSLVGEQAEEMGVNSLQFLSILTGSKNVSDEDQFENLLAWYAIEECSRKILEAGTDCECDLDEDRVCSCGAHRGEW